MTRVLLLPGLGLGAEAWAPTRDRLAGPATVQLLPGYGLPDRGADLRPRALAERLLAEPAAAGEPFLLAGHSASCQIAAHVAVLAPERVRGLLLVGPSTDPRAATWPRLAARWLRTAGHERPGQVPALARQYARTTLPSVVRAMEHARRDRIEQVLGGWSGPLLVVRGRRDRICPQDWARAVAERSPAGSVVVLPRGAHMVPLTHGHLLAPVVDRFVSAVGPRPTPDGLAP